MRTTAEMQELFDPLFPGLMGVEITEATQDKVVATMLVRPDLCTVGNVCHGGAFMAFADTLGAVGTVMNLPPNTRTTTIEVENELSRRRRSQHPHHRRDDATPSG